MAAFHSQFGQQQRFAAAAMAAAAAAASPSSDGEEEQHVDDMGARNKSPSNGECNLKL